MEDKVEKWIQKFQRISWEPEILISGGILFTLLQIPGMLVKIRNYLYPFRIYGLNEVLGIFVLGISGLTVGFSLHLIVKSLWVSMLSLKAAFPQGIKIEKLGFSNYFIQKSRLKTGYDDQIEKTGRSASQLFGLSFLFLLIFFGLGFYMTLMILLFYFLPVPGSLNINIVFIPLLILFIDFITLGGFKRNQTLSKLYYPVYKLFSILTLSFLYRNILFIFISNVSKRRIYIFFILFMILSSLMSYRNISKMIHLNTSFHNWEFFAENRLDYRENDYENERDPDGPIGLGMIQSFEIPDNFIKLYLRYTNFIDLYLTQLEEKYPEKSKKEIMNDFFRIRIDSITIPETNWLFTRKMNINQYGIIGIIPCYNINAGFHRLYIDTKQRENYFTISFWKKSNDKEKAPGNFFQYNNK